MVRSGTHRRDETGQRRPLGQEQALRCASHGGRTGVVA
jgi:hypothetical protein